MYSPRDVLARRKVDGRKIDGSEPTPGGVRRRLAATDAYEVHLESVLPRSYQGAFRSERGRRTYLVLEGALWIREAQGEAYRLVRGQVFTTTPARVFEVATGELGASMLLVDPAGFGAALERAPSAREPSPHPDASRGPLRAAPSRPAQGTFEERVARANAAQGLTRAQPLPGRTQTAADVSFGFSVPGTNLPAVVPEP